MKLINAARHRLRALCEVQVRLRVRVRGRLRRVGLHEGFFYTFWKDAGEACMTLGRAGRYAIEYDLRPGGAYRIPANEFMRSVGVPPIASVVQISLGCRCARSSARSCPAARGADSWRDAAPDQRCAVTVMSSRLTPRISLARVSP